MSEAVPLCPGVPGALVGALILAGALLLSGAADSVAARSKQGAALEDPGADHPAVTSADHTAASFGGRSAVTSADHTAASFGGNSAAGSADLALRAAECPFEWFLYDELFSGPLGVAIPDNVPTGAFIGSVQTAPELLIEDVIVDVNLTHSYAGDVALGIYYDIDNDEIGDIGPVMLMCTPGLVGCDFDGCCGCDGDLAGSYRFSDAATGVLGEVECTSVLATGCFAVDPSYGPLHGFNGLASGGRFILYAWDWEAGDLGTVEDFTVWVRRGCNHPVLNVPADYPTVQLALDAACSGDTIRIAPGTYGDAIRNMDFAAVTLEAADPEFPPTLGVIGLSDLAGGGLHDLVVADVTVQGFSAYGVTNVTASSLVATIGGGRFTMVDCRLGSLVYNGYRATVQSTHATSMQFSVQDDLELSNSVTGPAYVDFFGSGGARIQGNTFVHANGSEFSSVLEVRDFGTSTELENNLVVGAEDGTSTGITLDPEVGAPAVVATCNDVWRCAVRWNGIADPTGLSGNISADPLFCSAPTQDYSLAAGSPCLPGNHPNGANCGQIGALGEGCSIPVSVEDEPGAERPLVHAVPNPASGRVTFSIAAGEEEAHLRIFDASGRAVRTLVVAPGQGQRRVDWDQRNDVGDPVPAGVYFYQASAGPDEVTRQLIVLR